MKGAKKWYVYIMTNHGNTVLYTGFTGNLARRLEEHSKGRVEGFAKRYKAEKLVYYEVFKSPIEGIRREKQIKGWLRKRKLELIESINPDWLDMGKRIIT